jgi:hypothetical protein
MRSIHLTCVLLVSLLLSGCDQTSMMDKMIPPEDEATAKNYISLLRDNKFELIEKDLDPSLKAANIRQTLAGMAALIPAQQPLSVKVVGLHVSHFSSNGKSSTNTNITFEYQFPGQWLLANVATQKKDGGLLIVGFNVTPIPDSLENHNKFTLTGKSPAHYPILAMAILIPLFIVYVLVLCFRTKMEKRKWLWMLFIALGVGQFAVNWTTGQLDLNLLNIQLLGVSAFSPLYGAWTVSVSLPLGAIVYLFWRRRLAVAPSPITDSEQV